MRLQRSLHEPRKRRGMILLIVLVMLTLFAIAGLTFVLYATSAADSALVNAQSEKYATTGGPDMDPNTSLNLFLGQFVYGTGDDSLGAGSALRGHSLAETMYGSCDAVPSGANFIPMDVPYNGTGRLHEPNLFAGQDGYDLVNYTLFTADGTNPTPGSILRDPSRPGTRGNLAGGRTAYAGGQNAPYTYPDNNNMFLASMQASDGQVVTPSYVRSAVFGALNNPANPNWTNAQGKYMILRPRPAEMGPGFPLPIGPNGDVANRPGGPPDSIWIDINAPVQTTAAGLKYKMLVAPLIVDLDNRVNVNVHGNILGSGNTHASNQGWGPWEVNLSKVLNANAPEWNQLFINNAGRYGPGQRPLSLFALAGPPPHIYGPGDLNGLNDPTQPGAGSPTSIYSLPGGVGVPPYSAFPSWPAAGYGNNQGGFRETTVSGSGPPYNHPMFFNPMFPVAGNNLFLIKNNASLLWAGVPASPTADLRALCPNNFLPIDPTTNTTRRINQTTVLSMDLDRSGAAPYVWDPANPVYTVSFNPANNTYTYTANPTAFPTLPAAPPPGSDFSPTTMQSILPRALSRINLDRILTDYSNPAQADADRKQFASDIYTRLLAVTGMTNISANIASANAQQYDTLRWLAQLSANIVDYIDTDDVMTGFQWTNTPTAPDTGWVFGTELPKLTLNEVYLQYDNGLGENGMPGLKAQKPFQMNVWVELLNPLPSGADLNGPNEAVLQDAAGTALYQVVLSKPNASLRTAANYLGEADGATQPYAPTGSYSAAGQVLSVVSSYGAGRQVVLPVGNAYSGASGSNQGFFVLGPTDPTLATSYATPGAANSGTGMNYTVPLADPTANAPVAPTVLLRRLANPALAYQPNPGAAGYNPYVTVDYAETSTAMINDGRSFKVGGVNVPTPIAMRSSYGRTQPYAGAAAQLLQQQPNPAAAGPQTTMYRHNALEASPGPAVAGPNQTLKIPFDWLVHLDRPLISPIELLHVSGFKPHELTQQFVTGPGFGTSFNHVAPWQDPNARLYRLLEFAKVKNIMPGVAEGGRVPGKVNINTLDPTSKEVFLALCDAQPGNRFAYAADGTTFVGDGPGTYVDNVFNAIMAARNANGPFWGMAQGAYQPGDPQYPNGSGVSSTLLAAAAAGGPPGATHPYQNLELLNKIYNNVTTRSNCFAVWLTVGFFQVTDDTTSPMKLGAEINLAQGKNIRHHMFAIVDRTQVQTFATKVNPGGVAAGNNIPINVPLTVFDARTNRTWQIVAGATLVYDANTPNEETVVVQAGNTANFTLGHAAGAPVVSRGNPGPWIQYDSSQDTSVVPYVVIID